MYFTSFEYFVVYVPESWQWDLLGSRVYLLLSDSFIHHRPTFGGEWEWARVNSPWIWKSGYYSVL
jgi:hypothetical protein